MTGGHCEARAAEIMDGAGGTEKRTNQSQHPAFRERVLTVGELLA